MKYEGENDWSIGEYNYDEEGRDISINGHHYIVNEEHSFIAHVLLLIMDGLNKKSESLNL